MMPVYRATRGLSFQGITMEVGQMVDLYPGDSGAPELEALLRDGFLVPVPALDPTGRDTSPIPTDWDDADLLFRDMQLWAREHPKANFFVADDPGTATGRSARFGWVGYYVEDRLEYSKQWTITIPNMASTVGRLPAAIEGYMRTAQGRQDMLQRLVEAARQPGSVTTEPEIKRKTLWERLQEE